MFDWYCVPSAHNCSYLTIYTRSLLFYVFIYLLFCIVTYTIVAFRIARHRVNLLHLSVLIITPIILQLLWTVILIPMYSAVLYFLFTNMPIFTRVDDAGLVFWNLGFVVLVYIFYLLDIK